jgi:hypothetical protein
MSNTYKSTTKTWKVDETGTLNTGGVEIQGMYFLPNNAGDQIEITDNADNHWMHLWGDPGAANPKYFPLVPPVKMPSLKIATLSGGSILFIQFRTDY